MIEILLDSFFDTVKTLPFLLGAYLLIEWIAHKAGDRFKNGLQKFGKFGSFGGALLGLVPQCGFSVAAANFYADRIITPGTLIAVFVATSDEAIPILLANPGSGGLLFPLLGIKFGLAVLVGFLVDFGLQRLWKPVWEADSELQHDHVHMVNKSEEHEHACGGTHSEEEVHPHHAGCDHSHCEHCTNQLCEHCCSHTHCHGSIWKIALKHTIQVSVFIFIITSLLDLGLDALGSDRTAAFLMSGTVFQPVLAALFGLIPSCASSVFLTQLYLEGTLTFGSVIAGLSTGAGTGILILFQACRSKKECFGILFFLFVISSLTGILLQ